MLPLGRSYEEREIYPFFWDVLPGIMIVKIFWKFWVTPLEVGGDSVGPLKVPNPFLKNQRLGTTDTDDDSH